MKCARGYLQCDPVLFSKQIPSTVSLGLKAITRWMWFLRTVCYGAVLFGACFTEATHTALFLLKLNLASTGSCTRTLAEIVIRTIAVAVP